MAATTPAQTAPKQTEAQLLQQYADLELVGYLFNACYGGFGYSKEFIDRLNERRVAAGELPIKTTEYEYRSDPMAVALFRELGSKFASGPFASICLKWVPKEFLSYVDLDEYDGRESALVDFLAVKNGIVDTVLRMWKEAPETVTLADLNDKVENLKTKQKRYQEFEAAWWKCERSCDRDC